MGGHVNSSLGDQLHKIMVWLRPKDRSKLQLLNESSVLSRAKVKRFLHSVQVFRGPAREIYGKSMACVRGVFKISTSRTT